MTSEPLTTCLWFDDQAEEAARFYTSVFKDSVLGDMHRYTEAGPGRAGTVMLAEFELNGQKFTGLNGGKQPFGFNEAVSFCVTCADQSEVDYYWGALLDGGGEPSVCGWLKDRYGVRWQVVPQAFYTMVRDGDQARKARVTAAMLAMTKFDIAALEAAYAGASQ
jgi:predicted 3-demethylubiquinone-9 3-methyltransferase (glyoxalase superfamily)